MKTSGCAAAELKIAAFQFEAMERRVLLAGLQFESGWYYMNEVVTKPGFAFNSSVAFVYFKASANKATIRDVRVPNLPFDPGTNDPLVLNVLNKFVTYAPTYGQPEGDDPSHATVAFLPGTVFTIIEQDSVQPGFTARGKLAYFTNATADTYEQDAARVPGGPYAGPGSAANAGYFSTGATLQTPAVKDVRRVITFSATSANGNSYAMQFWAMDSFPFEDLPAIGSDGNLKPAGNDVANGEAGPIFYGISDDRYEQNDSQNEVIDRLEAATNSPNLGIVGTKRTIKDLVLLDEDWFRFRMPRVGTTADYVTLATKGGLDPAGLRICDDAGNVVAESQRAGTGLRISLRGLYANTPYSIHVNPSASDVSVDRPVRQVLANYSLTIKPGSGPTDDAYEENDTKSAVDSKRAGAPNSPSLGSLTGVKSIAGLKLYDAVDLYKFSMPKGAVPTDFVQVTFDRAQGDLALTLLSSDGEPVIASNDSTAGYERIFLRGLDAGTYYVQVAGVDGATNPNYALTIDPGSAAGAAAAKPVAQVSMVGSGVIANGATSIKSENDLGVYRARSSGGVAAQSSVVRIFQISNAGDYPLTLTGTPLVTIDSDAAEANAFTISQPTLSTLQPGQSTNFSVTFQLPVNMTGRRYAHITIPTDDPDRGSYSFSIAGAASAGGESGPVISTGNVQPISYENPGRVIAGDPPRQSASFSVYRDSAEGTLTAEILLAGTASRGDYSLSLYAVPTGGGGISGPTAELSNLDPFGCRFEFPAGVFEVEVVVSGRSDNAREPTETVIATLKPGPGLIVDSRSEVVNMSILDGPVPT